MVLSGAIAPVSAAQAPATQPAWVSANGGVSGIEMWALARDPDKPAIRYAGGPQGFVRSVDSGRTWVRSNQGLPPDCAINAILPLRGQSATLLVGCSGADYENGLYGSADRGDHWQLAGSGMLANTAVYAIAQSGGDGSIVLVATGTGIYRSADTGLHWSLVLRGEGSVLSAYTLARDPFSLLTYYATVSTGVEKSVDAGRTWFAINNDLNGVSGINTLATDPTRKDRLFLGTTGSGIYRSLDGGNSWASLSNAPSAIYTLLVQPLRAVPSKQLTPDLKAHLAAELAPPKPKKTAKSKPQHTPVHIPETALILAGTDSGVQSSVNGGDDWGDRTADANSALPSHAHPYAALPDKSLVYALLSFGRSAEIVASIGSGGIYDSKDLGRSWHATGVGLPVYLPINAIVVNPSAPGTVYFGTQGAGIERSQDSGRTLETVSDGLPDNAVVYDLLLQPARSNRLVAALGLPHGGVYISTDGSAWSESGLAGRSVYTVIADPRDPDTLYAGLSRGGVGWSATGGAPWRLLNRGLPPTAAVLSLAADPHDALRILAGTDLGLFGTTDQGDHWAALGTGLPAGAITALVFDPSHRHGFLAGTPTGLFRSLNGGKTWSGVGTALAGVAIHTLRRDPLHANVLVAATEVGVYRSNDNGTTWTALQRGIPGSTRSYAVAVAGPVLYAGSDFGPFFQSPTGPVAPTSGGKYFPLTGHSIQEPFLAYWQKHGGVRMFGYPRTEALDEGRTLVQYFQRARLEIAANSHTVMLSRLGVVYTAGRFFPKARPFANGPLRIYIAKTHHSVGAPFLTFWQSHGGAAVFGNPISEVLHEENGDGSGNAYVLQYFQNARLEYHPEIKDTTFTIQLGLLGNQLLQQKGWLQ